MFKNNVIRGINGSLKFSNTSLCTCHNLLTPEALRSAATAITTTRFNRYDIGIQLQEKSRIGGHAMDVIACGLAKIVAQSNGKENAHYYTASYAKRDVYDGSMCASFKTSETSTTDKP